MVHVWIETVGGGGVENKQKTFWPLLWEEWGHRHLFHSKNICPLLFLTTKEEEGAYIFWMKLRKRRGHIFFEWNKCLWVGGGARVTRNQEETYWSLLWWRGRRVTRTWEIFWSLLRTLSTLIMTNDEIQTTCTYLSQVEM